MSAEIIPLRRHSFREGDVVRLAGGAGRLMLVAVADGELMAEVTCIWMGGERNRRLMSAPIASGQLELVVKGSQ